MSNTRVGADIRKIPIGELFFVRWVNGNKHQFVALYERVSEDYVQVHVSALGADVLTVTRMKRCDTEWGQPDVTTIDPLGAGRTAGYHMLLAHGRKVLARRLIGNPWKGIPGA